MTAERQRLIEENTGLAWLMAFQLWPSPRIRRLGDFEDVLQTAFAGLCRAADYYDPNRGIKFSTYACKVIRQNLLAASLTEGGTIRLPQNALRILGESRERVRAALVGRRSLDAVRDMAAPAGGEGTDLELVQLALGLLTKDELRIVKEHFFQGQTYQTIGARLKISKQAVETRCKVALRRVGRQLRRRGHGGG